MTQDTVARRPPHPYIAAMPETHPPLDITAMSLSELATAIADRRLPPVEQWHPQHCGHSGMRIARDGCWFHEGRPIRRESMVRLFSTVLRREDDGSYCLVTPVEKLTIVVDFMPFLAVGMTVEGESEARRIAFSIDHCDPVILGPAHPLEMIDDIPVVHVRGGLRAALARPVYYELAELALADGPGGLWSGGVRFDLAAG